MVSVPSPVEVSYFDLGQANGLLPVVREAFGEVRPLHARLVEVATDLARQGFRPEILGAGPSGDLPDDVRARRWEARRLVRRIQEKLQPLLDLGIEVKAPDGLVDFRSRFHGRVVYLCWRWDESEIRWFHELDGGFDGRQEIADPTAFSGDERH